MAIKICNQGEEAFLDLITDVDMTIRLFQNDVESGLTEAQINALTQSSFTEATFTGYAGVSLTTAWTTTQGNPSTATRAQVTFTRTATGAGQTLYGYYMTRNSDGALMWHEYFPGPVTVTNNGDGVIVTPTFTLDDNQEATVAARGVIARQVLTASSSGFTADGVTDHVLNNVPVVAGEIYGIRFHGHITVSAAARWDVHARVNAAQVGILLTSNEGAAVDESTEGMVTWVAPTTQATDDFDVYLDEVSGTATFTIFASSTVPRTFEIIHLGTAP